MMHWQIERAVPRGEAPLHEFVGDVVTLIDLGLVGPAQSDDLFHFTGRNGNRPVHVPEEIRNMTPQERLDAILGTRTLRGFPPFGTAQSCICFSECTPAHLAHLVLTRGFSPWGVVVSRSAVLRLGGGSVAYVPDAVYSYFKARGLEHWAVRTGSDSVWLHEREWRLPIHGAGVNLVNIRAILIGDPGWRPSLVPTGDWRNGETGELLSGPDGNPHTRPVEALPHLWQSHEIWVWDASTKTVARKPPGTLC
ncbi:hypothetical protein [Streptomyces viridosporus]|uniref:hypothetical protein n=1 Tax=Streptomyces viridosporus TaxID=67581 RepID=UPI001356FDC1|nr:hypothetical protein [Streptomyces viridosporus]